MRFKNAAYRSAVIIIIILLSLCIGYACSRIGNYFDFKNHPKEYSELVEKYCEAYGIPEYAAYGVILDRSNFESNHVSSDGRIGLMQLSEDTFRRLTMITKETLDTGILYDPDTNIKYGVYLLSHLYTQYNRWSTVFAVYISDDEDMIKEWLTDDTLVDSMGNLKEIPDRELAEKVEQIEKNMEMYRKLYYTE